MNDVIATVSQPCCPFCGQIGKPLYKQLVDQLYGAPGYWAMSHCLTCTTAWLDPRPNDFAKLYDQYYTHWQDLSANFRARLRRWLANISLLGGRMALGYPTNMPAGTKLIARLMTMFRPGHEMAQMRFATIPAPATGAVLDVGCGSGLLLASLKDVGWSTVGIEIDPEAVKTARALGIEVHEGTLDDVRLEDGQFAYIVLNHVIEHVPNPIAYLSECARLLAPSGQLVVITPNLKGLSHRIFKQFWRGLEIPRHLIIFSPKALVKAANAAGLTVEKNTTMIRGAKFMYMQSARMRAGLMDIELSAKTGMVEKICRRAMGILFQLLEWLVIQFSPDSGDEILMSFSHHKQSGSTDAP